MRSRYLLRKATVDAMLDRNHLTHQRFADHLGLSRSYWSQVYNGRRHLTPAVRQCLLGSRYLKGLDEAALWDIVVAPTAEAA
jgi:hypothetical protein